MIIVDKALEKRHSEGNPVRVALVGSGYMGRGIALEIITSMVGMRLVAICNRTLSGAEQAYRQAGIDSMRTVNTVTELERAISADQYAITDDPTLICQAENIEAVIEATGEVEFGAHVAAGAIANGKHVILMNAELDSAVGPILKKYADRAGVVYTYSDGDEPGVAMNLYRFVKTIGYKPVLMGQIKGFLDRYRNPDTQRGFAEKHKQKAPMVASFADGSKLSIEGTIMANATGFKVGKRGMYGPPCADVKEVVNHFPADRLLEDGGWVDYVLGAQPGTGAFVVGYNDHPVKADYMKYFKMGDGPLYLFYTPFHLPHLQLPLTVARAVLFQDATLAPLTGPVCDTLTVAKRDLRAGEVLDGMGGFTCYGLIDTYEITQAEDFLPMVLSQNCLLKRDIPKDTPIRYTDVHLPAGRLCDKLRAEQTAYFASSTHSVLAR
jgi:predicted homoserine dehydrogenase-like protein